ncbi:MAG: hypothetical protein ACLQIB_36090 [Isosphaeraceae bacterium]
MSQLQQGQSGLAARQTERGAALPETSKTQDLLAQVRSCSEVAQRLLERAHEQLRHVTSLRDELGKARSENDRLRAALEDLRSQAAEGVRRENDGDLEAARLRIEQLTVDLRWASSANAQLRALLNVFGVVDHLESRPEPD